MTLPRIIKPTVLLVDDHGIVRQGLASLLSMTGQFGHIAQAEDGAMAVTIARALVPDMVVIDLLMPVMDAADAIRLIKGACPSTRVVVLTSSEEDDLAFAALDAGAQSFLLKSMSGEEILLALEKISSGIDVIHPSITRNMLRMVRQVGVAKDNPFSLLTPREIDVLKELANGASNARIGFALDITERTVKSHVGSVLSKLHLGDRTEAVAFAWRHGLIDASHSR